MMQALPLGQMIYIDGVSQSQSWHDDQRAERLRIEARNDFAMYAWLEVQGMLPAPGRLPSSEAMQAWNAYRSRGVIHAPAMRACNKCGECKPITEYYRRGSGKAVRVCMDCLRARSRAHQAAWRERRRAGK